LKGKERVLLEVSTDVIATVITRLKSELRAKGNKPDISNVDINTAQGGYVRWEVS
jgi:hypothetical protein